MSWSTIVDAASDGMVRMSVTSFGPHCRLPPPTITIRIAPSSDITRCAAHDRANEQHRNRARVVAELMNSLPRRSASLQTRARLCDHASVEVRHEVVVRPVHDEQRARAYAATHCSGRIARRSWTHASNDGG